MSEAATAYQCCLEIALIPTIEGVNEKGKISHVHSAVNKVSKDGWTWRRVKSFFYGEVEDRNVSARELRELGLAVLDARKNYAAYKRRTEGYRSNSAALIAALELQDEEFHRPSIDGLRGSDGLVDRSRDRGDE